MKDWTGNANSVVRTLGSSAHAKEDREEHDYYATEPEAVEMLCELETFSPKIWECACGEGHMSKVLESKGYKVKSTDLIDRGFGEGGIDFLKTNEFFEGDIITNPPYKYAQEFIEHALELIPEGNKVVMFLKVQFLEGQKRRDLFMLNPPKTVYVSSSRLACAKNGDFKDVTRAVAYAWFVWEKGFDGDTTIKWFN